MANGKKLVTRNLNAKEIKALESKFGKSVAARNALAHKAEEYAEKYAGKLAGIPKVSRTTSPQGKLEGVTDRANERWTEEENAILKKYPTKSWDFWGTVLNRSSVACGTQARELGIIKKGVRRTTDDTPEEKEAIKAWQAKFVVAKVDTAKAKAKA